MKNSFLKKGSLKQWLYTVNTVSQKLILDSGNNEQKVTTTHI